MYIYWVFVLETKFNYNDYTIMRNEKSLPVANRVRAKTVAGRALVVCVEIIKYNIIILKTRLHTGRSRAIFKMPFYAFCIFYSSEQWVCAGAPPPSSVVSCTRASNVIIKIITSTYRRYIMYNIPHPYVRACIQYLYVYTLHRVYQDYLTNLTMPFVLSVVIFNKLL